MTILLAPTICDGEVFSSYVVHNGFMTMSSQLRTHYADSALLTQPKGIEKLVTAFPSLFGPSEDVYLRNTISPAFERMSSNPDRPVRLRVMHGIGAEGQRANGILPGHPTIDERFGVCIDCLSTDVNAFGQPFFRTDFIWRRIKTCAVHGSPIFEYCDICSTSWTRIAQIGPEDVCACRKSLRQRNSNAHSASIRMDFEIAKGWHRLLSPETASLLNERSLRYAANVGARSRNIVTSDHRVDWDRAFAIFDQTVISEYAAGLSFKLRQNSGQRFLAGTGLFSDPLHTVFGLVLLCGSWESVEEMAADTAATSEFQPPGVRAGRRGYTLTRGEKKYTQAEIALAVSKYVEAGKSHPHLSHHQRVRCVPYKVRGAATIDRLIAAGIDVPLNRQHPNWCKTQDERHEREVRELARRLLSADTPYRMSFCRLIRGVLSDSQSFGPESKGYPRTRSAAKELSESRETYVRRRLKHAIRSRAFGADGNAVDPDLMSDAEVKRRWEMERKRIRKNGGQREDT